MHLNNTRCSVTIDFTGVSEYYNFITNKIRNIRKENSVKKGHIKETQREKKFLGNEQKQNVN